MGDTKDTAQAELEEQKNRIREELLYIINHPACPQVMAEELSRNPLLDITPCDLSDACLPVHGYKSNRSPQESYQSGNGAILLARLFGMRARPSAFPEKYLQQNRGRYAGGERLQSIRRVTGGRFLRVAA